MSGPRFPQPSASAQTQTTSTSPQLGSSWKGGFHFAAVDSSCAGPIPAAVRHTYSTSELPRTPSSGGLSRLPPSPAVILHSAGPQRSPAQRPQISPSGPFSLCTRQLSTGNLPVASVAVVAPPVLGYGNGGGLGAADRIVPMSRHTRSRSDNLSVGDAQAARRYSGSTRGSGIVLGSSSPLISPRYSGQSFRGSPGFGQSLAVVVPPPHQSPQLCTLQGSLDDLEEELMRITLRAKDTVRELRECQQQQHHRRGSSSGRRQQQARGRLSTLAPSPTRMMFGSATVRDSGGCLLPPRSPMYPDADETYDSLSVPFSTSDHSAFH